MLRVVIFHGVATFMAVTHAVSVYWSVKENDCESRSVSRLMLVDSNLRSFDQLEQSDCTLIQVCSYVPVFSYRSTESLRKSSLIASVLDSAMR